MAEATYLVSTNLQPAQLAAAGCSSVTVAAVSDNNEIALGAQGQNAIDTIADRLQLSQHRRSAMPKFDALDPDLQMDVLATLMGDARHDLTMLVEWIDNQGMWDWLMPTVDWRHEVEDHVLHCRLEDRSPRVCLILDNACHQQEEALATGLLNIERCFNDIGITYRRTDDLDRYLAGQVSFASQAKPDVFLCLTESDERARSVIDSATPTPVIHLGLLTAGGQHLKEAQTA